MTSIIEGVFFVGAMSLVMLGISSISYGRGLRRGLRIAAQVCVDSKDDPRPGFKEWLDTVDKS